MSWTINDVSGLILWCGADAGMTTASGAVSAWTDNSATGATIAQATSASRPAYNATGWMDSLPCLDFDGSDDCFAVTGLTSAATDMTAFFVIDQEALMYDGFDYLFDIETGRAIFAVGCDYDGLIGYYTTQWYPIWGKLGKQILSFTVGADGYYIRRNGELIYSMASGGQRAIADAVAIGSHFSGSGSHFTGKMAEIALYDSALSDTDREKIEARLAHKWLIGDKLAADHSYTSARLPVPDWGSSGGPAYQAMVDSLASGYERREAIQDSVYSRFNAKFDVQSLENMQEILAFFMAHKGRAYSFRYKDWNDYQATTETCSGSGTAWQLRKAYIAGTTTYWRTITRPIFDTVVLYDGGVEIDSDDYEIDYQTGVITLDSAASGTVTASFEFDCCVRFDTDEISQQIHEYDYGSTMSLPLVEVPA